MEISDVKLKLTVETNEFDQELLAEAQRGNFSKKKDLELRFEAEKIAKQTEITRLISYELIKKNLDYNLPHQQEGALHILKDLDCRAILADEVGLGKTITAGMILKETIVRGIVKKALILVPPALIEQWIAELHEKFELEFKRIDEPDEWGNNPLVIASIDKVKSYSTEKEGFIHNKAHTIDWDFIIVDEAHKLKNRKTARWKFVSSLSKKRFLMLTATPFQNDIMELYNLVLLLKRGHLGTLMQFKKRFMKRGDKRSPLNTQELRKKLGEVMIRRSRRDTTMHYRKRIPEVVNVQLSQEEREIYEEIIKLLNSKYLDYKGDVIGTKLAKYSYLPKVTSSAESAKESLRNILENEKYHEETKQVVRNILERYETLKTDSKMTDLLELIEKLIAKNPKEKILIYTKHPATLDYILGELNLRKIASLGYRGGMGQEVRADMIKKFKKEVNILVSTDTGAEGINLQFCHILINYDLPWNPMIVEQRIGRLDRIGQTQDIQIFSFATEGTMEDKIFDLIIKKMCCAGLVIGELPLILLNLGLDEEEELKEGKKIAKIEKRIYDAFIDSYGNLEAFGKRISQIGRDFEKEKKEYFKEKKSNADTLGSIK